MNALLTKHLPVIKYPTHSQFSSHDNVLGPVVLENYSELPRISKDDKLAYYGPRRIPTGGKADEGDCVGGGASLGACGWYGACRE